MEYVEENENGKESKSSTLILPALSIGNVGQLAVDLLISTTKALTVGYLDDPNVLPCVGNDAYGYGYGYGPPLGHLALPLQVYDSPSNHLSFVQQRSPLVKGMMLQFAQNLADFALAAGKKHVIVLSSLDFRHCRKVESGGQIHYLSTSNADGTDDECEKLGWNKLQEYKPSQRRWEYLESIAQGTGIEQDSLSFDNDDMDEEEDYYASLPFAALFSSFKARGLKVTCLLCYCSEGDNIADSINLAEAACKLVGFNPNNLPSSEDGGWIIPLSWKSVYGPPPDMSMF